MSKKRHKKSSKTSRILSILSMILSLAAIGGGIYLLLAGMSEDSQKSVVIQPEILEQAEKETKQQETEVHKTEQEKKEESKEKLPEMERLEIHFIDVGQGDAALFQCGGQTAMIDVGSLTAGKVNIVEYLETENIDSIDYLVFSHGHEDHIGAAYDIFWKSNLQVQNAVCDFGNMEDGNVSMIYNSMLEKQVNIIEATEGTVFRLGDVEFRVLMGREDALQKEIPEGTDPVLASQMETTNVNNQSIAIFVTHGRNTFLFYGDGEADYEKRLLEKCADIQNLTVLKAPHHGGGDSCTESILEILKPEYTIISSAPPQEYGFPKEEVLNRLQAVGSQIYCTYEKGSILVISNGKELNILWKN